MNRISRRGLLLFFLIVNACQLVNAQNTPHLPGQTHADEMQVIASIRPLALIAQDLLGDSARVDTLVTGAASPHDYALKVSDMRRLRDADLLIWMGPELERFLQKPVDRLSPERVLALGQERESAESGSHAQEHDHDSDLHQWLDPQLAQQMARAIASRLQQLYPAERPSIERRLDTLTRTYKRLNEELKEVLAPVGERGFVVQHRGYDYFIQAYGLNQLAWISLSPEQPPGVRHLYELEKALRARAPAAKADCLFVELSHQSATASNFAEQLQLRLQPLDILGNRASTYPELMHKLADDVAGCLSAP